MTYSNAHCTIVIMKGYNKKGVTEYNIHLQFVIVARYRRKIFAYPGVSDTFLNVLGHICETNEMRVLDVKFGDEYVHLHISIPPDISAEQAASKIRVATSKSIIAYHEELSRMKTIWTSHLLVGSNITTSQIQKFVSERKTRN